LGVVAIDRSGNLDDPAFYVAAVKKDTEHEQEHRALEMRYAEFQHYVKLCKSVDYREKISAACIFESLRIIIGKDDSVQIDMDFLGHHQEDVRQCLKRLLNKHKNCDPDIVFMSKRNKKWKEHLKEAHKKSRLARFKQLKEPSVKNCPDLSNLILTLKK